jgi:hypothetical protein
VAEVPNERDGTVYCRCGHHGGRRLCVRRIPERVYPRVLRDSFGNAQRLSRSPVADGACAMDTADYLHRGNRDLLSGGQSV